MGGGGDYYSRDVTPKSDRTDRGTTKFSERELSQSRVFKDFLPKNRRLVCGSLNPLVYQFDVTGSMGNLPKIIYDKWPGIVGQVVARQYLPEAMMSLCAYGDILTDEAPLQVADFSELRNMDRYFKQIFIEQGGGGQGRESGEMAAYFYAYNCDLPNAQTPIYLITCDEGLRQKILARDLRKYFGGEHQDTTAEKVFADLLKKFKGNVFLIHRHYPNVGSDGIGDAGIVKEWRAVLGQDGKDRVILMPKGTEGDLAVGDITLGVYAIVSGARTLKQYLRDMRTRPLDLGQDIEYEPQSEERIRDVEEALQPLRNFRPVVTPVSPVAPEETPGKKTSYKRKKLPGGKSGGKKDKSWKL